MPNPCFTSSLPCLLRLIAGCGFMFWGAVTGGRATTYTWDPGATAGVQPGDGTWDTSGANTVWTTDDGSTDVAWVDGSSNVISSGAIFAGGDTGGTITLTGNRTIAVSGNSLSFLNSGYTLESNNASVRTITFFNGTSVQVAGGKSATIGSNVTLNNPVLGGASGTPNGTLSIDSGGKITSSGTFSLLGDGTVVKVNAGAVINPGGSTVIGGTGDNATLEINGGSLTRTGTGNGNLSLINGATMTNASATVTIKSGGSITLGATNTSKLVMGTANSSTATTTFNLDGGTVSVGSVGESTLSGNATVSTFNFNGGVLQTGTTNVVLTGAGDFMGALDNVYVKAGGAKVDTSNGATANDITISSDLTHDSALGSTRDGGLEKLGAGTLTLTGSNTFTGDITITAGTLSVGSVFIDDRASVSIAAGAVFDLNFSGSDTIAGLSIGGSALGAGSYGATGSGATFVNDTYFTGTGVLSVVSPVPEPSTWALFAGVFALASTVLMRRRCNRD